MRGECIVEEREGRCECVCCVREGEREGWMKGKTSVCHKINGFTTGYAVYQNEMLIAAATHWNAILMNFFSRAILFVSSSSRHISVITHA